MNKSKTEKAIKFLLYFYFILLVLSVIIIFRVITINTESINFGKYDLSEKGFQLFYQVYKFPLYLIAASIPILGILVTLLRYYQFDRQFEVNKNIFKMSQYSFLLTNLQKHIIENNKSLSLGIQCENKSKFPVKIFSIDLAIYKNKELICNSENIEYFKVIFPDDKDGINPEFRQKKFSDEFFGKYDSIEITIKITYQGINNINHKIEETYLLDSNTQKYKRTDCSWHYDI